MKVLAIVAHPDDAEIHCGGTLAKCVKRGDEVTVCHLSDGNLGHMIIMPEELGKIRCLEAQNAGKAGGYRVIYGGFHDLDIYSENPEARQRVAEIIRSVKPDFIITHYPEDYMADHVAVSQLVYDASFCASIPHFPSEIPDAAEVVPIFYMSTSCGIGFIPKLYVNIDDEMEIKKQAWLCHDSQVKWLQDHDNADMTDKLVNTAKFWGRQCGARYAEGFVQCRASLKMRVERLLP